MWPSGEQVEILQRSPDAEFILEGEEFDLQWRFGEVPESLLPSTGKLVREEDLPKIRKWVDTEYNGDWRKAIASSPLLVIIHVQGVELLDGWHRLKLAREAGLKTIPVCFAYDTGIVSTERNLI